MLEGQAGPQHHGRGRDRETREVISGGLEKSLGPGQVTSVTWPGHSDGVRTLDATDGPKAFRVLVESSLILVPITQTSSDPLGLGGDMHLGEGACRRGRCGKRPPS